MKTDKEKLFEVMNKSLFLTEWEDDFMANVYAKLIDGIPLSIFETRKFSDIYDRLRED